VYDKKVKFADEEEEFKKIKGKFFSKLTMISSIQTKMC
jgi:hypothetical protein